MSCQFTTRRANAGIHCLDSGVRRNDSIVLFITTNPREFYLLTIFS